MSDIIPQNLAQCAFDFDALVNQPFELPTLTVHEQSPHQKWCPKCKKHKVLDDFHDCKNGKKGKSWVCKPCACAIRNSLPNNAVNYRRKRLRAWYNLELEEYDRMFTEQGGVCAICGETETASNQYGIMSLAVDHNHKTGKVRALLCNKCNNKLARFEENFDAFSAYLERYDG